MSLESSKNKSNVGCWKNGSQEKRKMDGYKGNEMDMNWLYIVEEERRE